MLETQPQDTRNLNRKHGYRYSPTGSGASRVDVIYGGDLTGEDVGLSLISNSKTKWIQKDEDEVTAMPHCTMGKMHAQFLLTHKKSTIILAPK